MTKKVLIEKFDDYPTGIPDARYLISLLPIKECAKILEPHANKGNFVRALQLEHPRSIIYANELQNKYYMDLHRLLPRSNIRIGDFLSIKPKKRFDWVIGNPPFSGNTGIAHVLHSMRMANNVAFFLPLRYLSSQSRLEFWNKRPAKAIWSIAERPVFVGGKGGRTDYAFYWWNRGHKGPRSTLKVISLNKI